METGSRSQRPTPAGGVKLPRHDTNIRVSDVATGKVRHTLEGHTAEVDCCAFSPDGKTVASGSKDKTIKFWDARTGKQLRTLTGHTGRVESRREVGAATLPCGCGT